MYFLQKNPLKHLIFPYNQRVERFNSNPKSIIRLLHLSSEHNSELSITDYVYTCIYNCCLMRILCWWDIDDIPWQPFPKASGVISSARRIYTRCQLLLIKAHWPRVSEMYREPTLLIRILFIELFYRKENSVRQFSQQIPCKMQCTFTLHF